MSEKMSICLNRGREELMGNEGLSIVRARKKRDGLAYLKFCGTRQNECGMACRMT